MPKSQLNYRQSARKRVNANPIKNNSKRRRLESNTELIESIQVTPIHKRYFFHSTVNRPFLVRDHDESYDSTDEMDYVRVYQKVHVSEINDFVDLNEGEKEMINLWNSFLYGYKSFGDKHVMFICRTFIDKHVDDILQKKLYRNFLLHLCTLHDYNTIEASDFTILVQHFQQRAGIITRSFLRFVEPLSHETQKGSKRKSDDIEPPTENQ